MGTHGGGEPAGGRSVQVSVPARGMAGAAARPEPAAAKSAQTHGSRCSGTTNRRQCLMLLLPGTAGRCDRPRRPP